jgi:hypothetical protein
MAQRLVILHRLAAIDVQGPCLSLDGAESAAVGAGLLGAQRLGLLLQSGGESAFAQSGGGRSGDLLQGGEIEVETGALFAEGAAGDDFAPLGSENTDILEVLRGEWLACHRPSCLEVAETGRVLLSFLLYGKRICQAKQVLTSHPKYTHYHPCTTPDSAG